MLHHCARRGKIEHLNFLKWIGDMDNDSNGLLESEDSVSLF